MHKNILAISKKICLLVKQTYSLFFRLGNIAILLLNSLSPFKRKPNIFPIWLHQKS